MSFWLCLFNLVLLCSGSVCARPSVPNGFFPQMTTPRRLDQDDINYEKFTRFSQPADYNYEYWDPLYNLENPLTKSLYRAKSSFITDGFFPENHDKSDLYGWKKRFHSLPLTDIAYHPDYDIDDDFNSSVVKKRDYTAAQLVNMLKALAKARRQRKLQITGKSLRFGISK